MYNKDYTKREKYLIKNLHLYVEQDEQGDYPISWLSEEEFDQLCNSFKEVRALAKEKGNEELKPLVEKVRLIIAKEVEQQIDELNQGLRYYKELHEDLKSKGGEK